MFDGKIARTKKNRTDDEKNFGIQIDSLCDVVCFGIFPAMICYCLGVNTPAGIGALIFYSVASVIRLAYFNVSETKRQNETSEPEKDMLVSDFEHDIYFYFSYSLSYKKSYCITATALEFYFSAIIPSKVSDAV
mgnify:CR=1 FL=1